MTWKNIIQQNHVDWLLMPFIKIHEFLKKKHIGCTQELTVEHILNNAHGPSNSLLINQTQAATCISQRRPSVIELLHSLVTANLRHNCHFVCEDQMNFENFPAVSNHHLVEVDFPHCRQQEDVGAKFGPWAWQPLCCTEQRHQDHPTDHCDWCDTLFHGGNHFIVDGSL